jgi:RNA recognition motif-containing protein
MLKRIFVGNIPLSAAPSEVVAVFEEVGHVLSIEIVLDRNSGLSRGYGFIEMSNEDAQRAVARLNGIKMRGRHLAINEAVPLRPQTEVSQPSVRGVYRKSQRLF